MHGSSWDSCYRDFFEHTEWHQNEIELKYSRGRPLNDLALSSCRVTARNGTLVFRAFKGLRAMRMTPSPKEVLRTLLGHQRPPRKSSNKASLTVTLLSNISSHRANFVLKQLQTRTNVAPSLVYGPITDSRTKGEHSPNHRPRPYEAKRRVLGT